MKLQIISAALPPALDGIGDYTAQLTTALACAGGVTLSVLTGQRGEITPLPVPLLERVFDVAQPASVRNILPSVARKRPDWLLLQYNAFSYGKWGLNLHLPQVMRALKRHSPQTRFALMAHETFMPLTNWKFAVMTTWQRWQLHTLIEASDVTFFSIDPWTQRFRRRYPGKRIEHLPVGSNLPRVAISREEARRRLGFAEGTLVLGLFGAWQTPRLLARVRRTMETLGDAGHDVAACYVGPNGATVREALGRLPNVSEGPLPADEVSRRFAAMDLYLAPFVDGVSTRRTTLMSALQHGVATVGTTGELTDNLLNQADGNALLLANVNDEAAFCAQALRLAQDATLRQQVGDAGARLHETHFDWKPVTEKLLMHLKRD